MRPTPRRRRRRSDRHDWPHQGAAQRANTRSSPDRSDRHWTRPITSLVFKAAVQ
jgi:hypothetical protein